jgi:cbb3-type cytochrome oxidase subunit 3
MNELRSVVTVISFVTFIGIVWWAWRPGSKLQAELVMSDTLLDDDRHPRTVASPDETRR